MKIKRNQTALIKDLEKQVDFLVGYTPGSNHWKMEYHVRNTMIDETLCSDNTPPEIREKINRIQDSLWRLREGKEQEQPYLMYREERKIPIKEGSVIIDYITL